MLEKCAALVPKLSLFAQEDGDEFKVDVSGAGTGPSNLRAQLSLDHRPALVTIVLSAEQTQYVCLPDVRKVIRLRR